MTDAKVQELLDKQAIREALQRYARGVDRLDAEVLASAYHDDATDDRGAGGVWQGADEIARKLVKSIGKTMTMTSHHVTNVNVRFDGDRAAVETYSIGVHVTAGDEPKRMFSSGRYIDRFERRNGEWRIAHRRLVTDMVRTMSLDEEVDLGPAAATRDGSDPSYHQLD